MPGREGYCCLSGHMSVEGECCEVGEQRDAEGSCCETVSGSWGVVSLDLDNCADWIMRVANGPYQGLCNHRGELMYVGSVMEEPR